MDKDLLLKLLLFFRASLVAQWQRIHLPMQETRVQSLIQEDPTCQGAAKPMCHNYWACALKPGSRNSWAWVLQRLSPGAATAEPGCCNGWARVLQLLSPGCNGWAQAATAEPVCCNHWAQAATAATQASGACVLHQEESPQWEACAPQQEKSPS